MTVFWTIAFWVLYLGVPFGAAMGFATEFERTTGGRTASAREAAAKEKAKPKTKREDDTSGEIPEELRPLAFGVAGGVIMPLIMYWLLSHFVAEWFAVIAIIPYTFGLIYLVRGLNEKPNFQAARFMHEWVIAPSGSGKTQLLQSQIVEDLDRVQKGEASIIIIDSQGMDRGKLLSNVANLKLFAPGQPLEGKLVLLGPDPDHPLALNIFDMGQYNSNLSARDRQILHAASLQMITFCLAGTTDQQRDMIEYLVQLAMVVPGANINTIRRMLTPKGLEEFRPYLAKVDEVVRDYFLHSFNVQSQNVTKEAVTRRIMGMLKNPVFRKMYQNERNKFNMREEIDSGKVIIINTDVALLGPEACELFGRFFIAQLLQATQQRKSNTPVYCYIDECQDYIATDETVASLLDKARKQHVAFILAHQRLANIKSANVIDALSNAAIKFAGGNDTDAHVLARYMHTKPEFISTQKQGSFAMYVRNLTPEAEQYDVQGFLMEKMDKMTAAEARAIQDVMHERYSVSSVQRGTQSTAAGEAPTDEWDPDEVL